MARRIAPLVPRKVLINGQVRWEVRVPTELQPQEKSARPRFLKESEAKGYCNRLKSDLLRYSDKARGLTDAQKIEAHACFERLAAYPAATLSQAVDLLLVRLNRAARSFPVSELAARVVADKKKQGGRGSSERLLREIEERLGRFSRVFGDRMVSDIEAAEVRAWLMDLTSIVQTSRGKEETDAPVGQPTRHAYRRTLSLCFGWAKHNGAAADNPIADVKLAPPKKEREFVFTPQQTAILLQSADESLRPYLALCAFAGLRPEQAQRLWWDQIHFDRGTHGEIEVPEGTDKAGGERIVPIQPNLRAWLLAVPKEERKGTVPFSRRIRRRAYSALREADSSLPEDWPQDGPRHGYGTYRLKVTGSFGQVADEMGNSEKTVRADYHRSVSLAAAEAYWQIYPPKPFQRRATLPNHEIAVPQHRGEASSTDLSTCTTRRAAAGRA